MTLPFRPGSPQVKVLASDGVTALRTVDLPCPTANGVRLTWKEKNERRELIDGSERIRRVGFLPVLTLKWSIWDDQAPGLKYRGPNNGNLARLKDLIDILSNPQGQLSVSPAPPTFGTTTVTNQGFGAGDGATLTFQLQQAAGLYYTDSFGTVWTVPLGPRTNLILYSQDLTNAVWNKIGGGSAAGTPAVVTGNYGVAPDGTLTACRVQCSQGSGTSGSDYSLVKQGVGSASQYPAGAIITLSVWLKSNTGSNQGVSLGAYGGDSLITITPAWARYSIQRTIGIGPGLSLEVGLTGNATPANSVADFSAWGAQMEFGSSATAYIPTTNAAVTVTPSYWPATGQGYEASSSFVGTPQIYRSDWQGNQLLYSTVRTNLVTQSETLDNGAWGAHNTVVVGNTATAPNGAATADKVNETAVTGQHYSYASPATLVSGQTYTASIFVKAAERSIVIFQGDVVAGNLGGSACFDLSAGVVSNIGAGISTATMISLSNGWWRLTITAPATGTSAYMGFGPLLSAGGAFASYLGVASSGFYAWGAQLDLGAAATSYIPTTTAAASVTDYSITATGSVTFSTAPSAGAWLNWSGTYQEVRRGFRALVTKFPNLDMVIAGVAGEVDVEFTGRDATSTQTLGVF